MKKWKLPVLGIFLVIALIMAGCADPTIPTVKYPAGQKTESFGSVVSSGGYDPSDPTTAPGYQPWVDPDAIAVTFNGVTSNVNGEGLTTSITLSFSAAIEGLAPSNIAITGDGFGGKGTLSAASGTAPNVTYTLGVTVDDYGTWEVKVTIAGYTVSGNPQSVYVYVPFVMPDEIDLDWFGPLSFGDTWEDYTNFTFTGGLFPSVKIEWGYNIETGFPDWVNEAPGIKDLVEDTFYPWTDAPDLTTLTYGTNFWGMKFDSRDYLILKTGDVYQMYVSTGLYDPVSNVGYTLALIQDDYDQWFITYSITTRLDGVTISTVGDEQPTELTVPAAERYSGTIEVTFDRDTFVLALNLDLRGGEYTLLASTLNGDYSIWD